MKLKKMSPTKNVFEAFWPAAVNCAVLTTCCLQVEGGVSSALLSTGKARAGVQSASPGLPREKRKGCTGQHLVMGHTDDDGASLLQQKAESELGPEEVQGVSHLQG